MANFPLFMLSSSVSRKIEIVKGIKREIFMKLKLTAQQKTREREKKIKKRAETSKHCDGNELLFYV